MSGEAATPLATRSKVDKRVKFVQSGRMKRFFGLAKFGMLATPVAIGVAMLLTPVRLDGLLLAFLIAAPLGLIGFFLMSSLDRASPRRAPLLHGGSALGPFGESEEDLASAGAPDFVSRDAYVVPTDQRRFTDPQVAAVGMRGGYTATGEYVDPW